MKIENVIDQVFDFRARSRKVDDLRGIMVHRVGVDHQTGVVLGYDGVSIAECFIGRNKQFAGVAAATGGENAYTFYLGGDCGSDCFDGRIWQALPISEVGYHARRFSKPYIGIACVGDFRQRYGRPPSPRQWSRLVELVANLMHWIGLDTTFVVGHGEVAGAHGGEKAPGQPAACPGELLDMDKLRASVADRMAEISRDVARENLSVAGFAFPAIE